MHCMLLLSDILLCMHARTKKTDACMPYMEWKKQHKKKKGGDTCSKRHWFIFQSARVRSGTVKRGSITNKWTCDKKEKIPFKFALWCESFMQMEFQMRWSHLQRPWLFFHSPLLKFMPPLIYNFINSSLLRRGKQKWWNSFTSVFLLQGPSFPLLVQQVPCHSLSLFYAPSVPLFLTLSLTPLWCLIVIL